MALQWKDDISPHHPQNHLRLNAHFSNSTKSRPHILQAGAQQIDFVVDNQETVVVAVGQLNELDFRILGIVFFQVGEKLFVVTGVDGRWNTVDPLCEHGEHSVVNVVVNQDDSLSSTPNEIGDVGPRIPDAASGENLLWEKFSANVLDFVKNDLNRFICLQLMLLNVEDPLYDLCVVIDELRNHGESPHNTDVDFHRGVRP